MQWASWRNASCMPSRDSQRVRRRRGPWSQAMADSATHRIRPRPEPCGCPRRAILWSRPSPRSTRRTPRSGPRWPGRSPTMSTRCWCLRLPRRALGPPAYHGSHRIDLRNRAAAEQGPKGAGSAAAALTMVFKLVESAQARWRSVNAPHLVALGRAAARFERDHLVERPKDHVARTTSTNLQVWTITRRHPSRWCLRQASPTSILRPSVVNAASPARAAQARCRAAR